VSRAYYAAFYAARAAVEITGAAPKTHSGLRSKFADLARSSPMVGGELGTALADLGAQPGDADYGEPADIAAEDARQAIDEAGTIVDAVDRFLESPPRGPSDP
jgi:uncharacterized protein (UPF0332 family)